jgi:hypothetical protein
MFWPFSRVFSMMDLSIKFFEASLDRRRLGRHDEEPGRSVTPLTFKVIFESDAVLGQSARLIRAQNIDGAEVLNRVDVLDDDFLFAHRNRPFGEAAKSRSSAAFLG